MSGSGMNAAPSQSSGGGMSKLRKAGAAVLGLSAVAGIMWITRDGPPPEKEAAKAPQQETAGQVGATYEGSPRPQPTTHGTAQPSTTTAERMPAAYLPAPLMVFGRDEAQQQRRRGAAGEDGAQAPAPAEPEADPLSRRLHTAQQGTAVAYRTPDRNLFLSEGTPMACVPDAPITSDVEGSFRCKVPHPVYAESGNLPLLDEGTWISGRVGAGLRRGQRRLFVVFTKIEAPDGCKVRINAPGADALGQAGLDGEVDNHFFQRFGAYLGMAFVDTAMQGAVLAASNAVGRRGGLNFFQFQNAGRQGGRDLFAEDAAIPPTLGREQARPLIVRLTQDVDLRPCYRLRLREASR